MKLYHYRLIPSLPDSVLKKQWKYLNCLFKTKKYGINTYIKDYPDGDLYYYTCLVANEMEKRGFYIRNTDNVNAYFKNSITVDNFTNWTPGCCDVVPFKNHHTEEYFIECVKELENL